MYECMDGAVILAVGVVVNPYEGKLESKKVEKYYNEYSNVADGEALEIGVPDKFTVECVRKYIWDNGNYTLKKVNANHHNSHHNIRQCTNHQ